MSAIEHSITVEDLRALIPVRRAHIAHLERLGEQGLANAASVRLGDLVVEIREKEAKIIKECARECAESPIGDADDRAYLAEHLGRAVTADDWARFVELRTGEFLRIEDEQEADKVVAAE